MNVQILCAVVALSANPQPDPLQPMFLPAENVAAVFRAQTPQYDEDPAINGQYGAPPQTFVDPNQSYVMPGQTYPGGGTVMPYQQPYGVTDPFLTQPGAPGAMVPAPGMGAYGIFGPQPYRFGWQTSIEGAFIPKESTSNGMGDMSIFELDTEFRETMPLMNGWIFSVAPQIDVRWWGGPANPGLPPRAYRFGSDFQIETPARGPWSMQLGFTPSMNTDLQRSLNSEGWFFDARGMIFLRSKPNFMWVLGAGFWDRVTDRVVPYAGIVFNPNDRWEWRLVFPEARISYFLGDWWFGVPQWLYVTGEYNVEAYQIVEQNSRDREQIELEDWRLLIGLRSDNGVLASFAEAGWIFGREVDFAGATTGFDISSGFIARVGLRY